MTASPFVLRCLAAFAVAACCSSLALADEFCDLAVEHVSVVPVGPPGAYRVDVDVTFVPGANPPATVLLVRVYANGNPQGETPIGTFGSTSTQCCTNGDTCVAVSGYTAYCSGTCVQDSNWNVCTYRRTTSFDVTGMAPGTLVTAVVDPDGWHVESCASGTGNNAASAIAPAARFYDLSLESLTLVPLTTPGAFSATVGVRLVPGGDTLTLPPVLRFYRGGAPIDELTIDQGHGLSGPCCDIDGQCPATDGMSASCEETCPGGIGGTKTCVYRLEKSRGLASLAPGDVVSAVIDPDGLYYEHSSAGTSNNAAAATVPQAIYPYCTGKLNSAGCMPSVTFSGAPSATSPTPFVIAALQVLPGRNGVLFYGHQQAALPFLGGTLCVHTPVRRTGLQTSSGDPAQPDCSGAFFYDFNARIQSGVDPTLVPGAFVAAQYWYRDSASSAGTGLSNALWFQIAQ